MTHFSATTQLHFVQSHNLVEVTFTSAFLRFQPVFLTEIPDDRQAHALVPVLCNCTLYYRFDGTNNVIPASMLQPKPLEVLNEILNNEDASNALLDAFGDFILSKEGRNTVSDAMDALSLDDDTESNGSSTITQNDSETSGPLMDNGIPH